MAGKPMPTTNKRSTAFTGKSKVISTGKFPTVRGGSGNHMFGKQSVKAAKAR